MPPRRRRLDQRHLLPADYFREPLAFGYLPEARMHLPTAGDPVSLQVAWVQHRVALAIRARNDRTAASRASGAFRFSKQYWSLCLQGRAWMGETVLASAVMLLLEER